MKTNSQVRTHVKNGALQAINKGAAFYPIETRLVLNVLEDLSGMYKEVRAQKKENKKLLKRLEKIKWITSI